MALHVYLKSMSISAGRFDADTAKCIRSLINIDSQSDEQRLKVNYVLQKLNSDCGIKIDADWIVISDFSEVAKRVWWLLWRGCALAAFIAFLIFATRGKSSEGGKWHFRQVNEISSTVQMPTVESDKQ